MHKHFEQLPLAITISDTDGNILDMNERSAQTFTKRGGKALIGKNLMDCHPEPARQKLIDLLQNPRINAYTIEKEGQRKLIYQAPWYDGDNVGGMVELSLVLPDDMPHYVRKG
ncbi:MAG: PAS domain-containing protein [Bacteroidales bacterium]|nr:PAS domain-containing protein [Candidatus Colimorpha onthohippi]